ncbi:MAG: acyltransferase [Actinobacteria bacterium]|nr:acyltransferase [Actinomycetota bacterium]
MTGVTTQRPARFQLLDYLRFIAAAMVVVMHYTVNGIANGKVTSLSPNDWATPWAKYGYLGVSLFFIISGFVITKSAHGKTARQFAVGRAVRLYPAFWVALIFTSTLALFLANEKMEVTGKQIAANFTMLSTKLGQPLVDGAYWTLVYELQFYAMIFAFLFFGLSKRLNAWFPVWVLLMVVASVIRPDAAESLPGAGGYYFLFAAGALIAMIRDNGPRWHTVLPLVASWVMSLRFGMKEAGEFLENKGSDVSPIVVAVILTLFFLAVLSMCVPRVAGLQLPAAQPIGALTYPVYLLHAHFGYMMLDNFATDSTKWLVYPVLLVSLIALAQGLHWLVETGPRLAWWKRTFDQTLGALVDRVQPARWRTVDAPARSERPARVSD